MEWDLIYKNSNGVCMPEGDVVHTVYVKIINKYTTINSVYFANIYIMMQAKLLEDKDCACILVETMAKNSQNIKWTVKVDGKRIQHRLIRRVSMDKIHEILIGKDAVDLSIFELI